MEHSPGPDLPAIDGGGGTQDVRCAGYAIDAEAAFGRSARIFRARDVASGQLVALKIFDQAQADETRITMRREAAAAAAVAKRANGATFEIVTVHGAALAEIDGHACPALVCSWFDGMPIGPWLRQPHGVAARTRLVHGLLDALAALHAAGFAHNDLSLGNVMVGDKVALIDFGRATPPGESDALLRTLAANAFYDGGPDTAEGGVAHDLRAFAILAMLVLARHHPFSARPAELFAGATDAHALFRHPPDLAVADPDGLAAVDLGGWLGPALILAPGESAVALRRCSPLNEPGHG